MDKLKLVGSNRFMDSYADVQREEMREKLNKLVNEQKVFYNTARERDEATLKRHKYSR
jgi:hypothetical protein